MGLILERGLGGSKAPGPFTEGRGRMAYHRGKMTMPTASDFVIDAHHSNGQFAGEIGRFREYPYAYAAFVALKQTTLSQMILRLRQGAVIGCTYHPQLGGAPLPVLLPFPTDRVVHRRIRPR